MSAFPPPAESRPAAPSFGRRLLCMAYEFCLLFGIAFVSGYLLLTLEQWRWPLAPARLAIFQAYMFVAIGVYFVWFWRHGGQTLAMKTWRIRLVAAGGARIGLLQACLRYLLIWWGLLPGVLVAALAHDAFAAAWTFVACTAFSFAWMRFDRDRQFLHDRVLGTRLVSV